MHTNCGVDNMDIYSNEIDRQGLVQEAEVLADANLFMNVFVDLFHGAIDISESNSSKVEKVQSSLRMVVELGERYTKIVDDKDISDKYEDITLHYFYNNLCMVRRVLNRIIRAVNPNHFKVALNFVTTTI